MREYTMDSVVHALRVSNSTMSNWPEDMLGLIAEQATYLYLEPNEFIVYMNEWYVSSGIVVLLHGEVNETKKILDMSLSTSDRFFESERSAPAVFCDHTVLCRDASISCIKASGYADVAILPARWVWDVIQSYVVQRSGGKVLDCLKFFVLPLSEDIMNRNYYSSSLVFRRSWMWSLLKSSDRVKIARRMKVKVFCIGDTIFSEGDRDPHVYIIRRGGVKLVLKMEPLEELDTGASFGEMSVLFDEPRCCRVVATTMCEVYCLHRRHLMKYLLKRPEVYDGVIQKALQRRAQWLEDGKRRDIMGLAALLAGVPCLSQTTERVRTSLAMTARAHVLPPQCTLFTKGTPCEHLFVVGRGTLALGNGGVAESLRTTREFVGELCLSPHLWPGDVVTSTSVDGWSLHVSEILKTLSIINADAQAVDICQQGIELYRAQHGPNSVIEGNMHLAPLSPKNSVSNGTSSCSTKMTHFSDEQQASVLFSGSTTPLMRDEVIARDFDWIAYAKKDKLMSSVDDDTGDVSRCGDRRALEQSIESELRRRVGELISVSVNGVSNAIDCDFSGDIEDIQHMLVEQVFLMPTHCQPKLLRQINRSKITLVLDDGMEPAEDVSSERTIANDLTRPQQVAPQPMVYTHDGITAFSDGNPLPDHENTIPMSPRIGLDIIATPTRRICSPEVSSSFRPQFQQLGLDDTQASTLRSRPHSSILSHSRHSRFFSGVGFGRGAQFAATVGCTQGLSRTVSFSNRRNSGFGAHTVSQGSECLTPTGQSGSDDWSKGKSIDLSQKAKINTSLFQSALDRYVKLNDENYFHEMVRVRLPLQPEEQWFEEETNTFDKGSGGLMLVLMHVRRCEGLEISEAMKSPIVKVSTDTRVLIRTPVMQDRERPVWPIDTASFISFIRRDTDVYFTVCDAEDEKQLAYTATLSTHELQENGGVGLQSLRLTPRELSSSDPSDETQARIDVCMMAVTASKYSNLQRRLAEAVDDDKSSDDVSTVYLQVLGVQGLKHRIEASVSVCVETDGKSKELLRTLRVTPKTRSPSWPGQSSFCVIKSDGVVSFDLYHRDLFLASYDTPVDTLAFSGTGIHVFPLTRAQGNDGEMYGNVYVSILGIKTSSSEENALNRPAKVLVVHVESFKMASEFEEFTPDPFVILRGPGGEVILRTTLNLGTYNAKWTEEEASCFITCPLMPGCTATYRLEVYDNNESNKVGTADMTVTMNGTKRNRMQFSIGNKGTLTVWAHSFSIMELPRKPSSTNDSLSSSAKDDSFLLSIHVSGCDSLQGTGFDDFQIDPLVTARLGRKRMVVAPLVSGTTAPRWSYPKATFVIPVLPEVLSHITLEVWDTNIELCDVLGVARISIQELCQTGTHNFTLQPHKDQEFGRRRNLGTITVKTRFGRKNGEVILSGLSGLFLGGNSCGPGLFDSRLFQYSSGTPDLPVTRVRVHVSNCCALPADVLIKSVRVNILCLQHLLLEVEKTCDDSKSVAWSLGEAQTVVDLRAIYGRSLRLAVACSSSTSGGAYTTLGAAFVPFSTLVSSAPEEVAVRSFALLNVPDGERGASVCDGGERPRGNSVGVDAPSVTISLFALDAAHSVGLEND